MPIESPPTVNPATLPGYELAYAERTTNVSISATSSNPPTDLGLSSGALAFDGSTRICVTVSCSLLLPASVGDEFVEITLYDGTLDAAGRMGGWLVEPNAVNVAQNLPLFQQVFLTPSAGSHTYKLGGWYGASAPTLRAGTGTVVGSAEDTRMPAYIRVTRA